MTGSVYQSAADCPLGNAHGMASTHGNANDETCCDFCGFPVEHDRDPVDDWEATYRYCELQWQEERGVMLDKIASLRSVLAEIRKLRDGYASQAKFADHEPASYFREFVRRLDAVMPDLTPLSTPDAGGR